MKVGGVRARTQASTVTKISTDIKADFGGKGTNLVSGISVLHMYCSTKGARFIPLTELEKYCLYTCHKKHEKFWECSPEEDHVPAPHSWDPSGAKAGNQAQAEHKGSVSNLNM